MKARFKMPAKTCKDPNAGLDAEIREDHDILDLNATQRLELAAELTRRADQLVQSANIIDPNLGTLQPAKKVPRNFFLVNMAQREQDEMRDLARECGHPLRGFIRWALLHTREIMKEKLKLARSLGVKPSACWTLIQGNDRN